jgi:hypothetical protein
MGLVLILAVLALPTLKTPHATRAPAERISAPQATQAAPATSTEHPAKPAEVAPAMQWGTKFYASTDYLQFVKDALPAAQAGDGRAAWHIGDALHLCGYIMRTYKDSADPEAQLTQELVSYKGKQWERDVKERKIRRCLGLARENPAGDHPASYWFAQALAAGDMLARADAAGRTLSELTLSPLPDDVKAAKIKSVEDNLRAVVESGDPDALFRVGMFMIQPTLSTDTLRGAAVALASCDLGHDCSKTGPDGTNNCEVSTACPANADFAYFLQQSLGSDKYAQVYAHAQEVEQAARARDWNTVMAYLQIDKH